MRDLCVIQGDIILYVKAFTEVDSTTLHIVRLGTNHIGNCPEPAAFPPSGLSAGRQFTRERGPRYGSRRPEMFSSILELSFLTDLSSSTNMAEAGSSPQAQTSIGGTSPLKPVSTEEEVSYAPAVSSPLNPDTAKQKNAAPVREQREKKESWKKREAKGGDAPKTGTPDTTGPAKPGKKAAEAPKQPLELQRYVIEKPRPNDFNPPAAPTFVPDMVVGDLQMNHIGDHVHNKRGFRYRHAIADPEFPHTNYTRQTEVEPFGVRFDYEDSSANMQFSDDGRTVATDKGFRMARANVGLREGRWYWELKVISGIRDPTNPTAKLDHSDFGGHFRAGISRREASLEHPVGFDCYSYGLRDAHGQKFHMSMPEKLFPPEESLCQGDVLGFELQLPSLALHRRVVEGTYNKAADVVDEIDPSGVESANPKTLLRDRYPIRHKNELYHEHYDYQPTKELEERFQPPAFGGTGANAHPPNPNHAFPALRTLPNSFLKVYKNGNFMGTAFEDLLAFLPPASRPSAQGAREGLDDGTLGYYPSVAVFSGGAVQANFGPEFEFPPPASQGNGDVEMGGDDGAAVSAPAVSAPASRLRPVCERYNEQISEDVVLDIIDEVDCWMQDGGVLAEPRGAAARAPAMDAADSEVSTEGQVSRPFLDGASDAPGNGSAEAIKELIQDDE